MKAYASDAAACAGAPSVSDAIEPIETPDRPIEHSVLTFASAISSPVAHMYAHGLGLSRDFHLAKRHYDMAAESATEAYAPVKLAMLELYALQALDTFSTGQGSGPFPVASSAGLLLRSVAAPAALQAWMPELDTLLILVLSVILPFLLLI